MTAMKIAGVDAIRTDGGLVHIRTVVADDAPRIRALHARASDRSIFLRFFSVSRATAEGHVAKLISMVAFWGVLVSLFIGPPLGIWRTSAAAATPEQVLAGRFARGEIDHDEYASRQAALRTHTRA